MVCKSHMRLEIAGLSFVERPNGREKGDNYKEVKGKGLGFKTHLCMVLSSTLCLLQNFLSNTFLSGLVAWKKISLNCIELVSHYQSSIAMFSTGSKTVYYACCKHHGEHFQSYPIVSLHLLTVPLNLAAAWESLSASGFHQAPWQWGDSSVNQLNSLEVSRKPIFKATE